MLPDKAKKERKLNKERLIKYYKDTFSSDFLKDVAETFVAKAIIVAISMVTTIIIARILGPEGRGLFAVAGTITAMGVQFGNLGIHSSNTYYVARDRKLLPLLIGNSLFVSILIGGLCSFIVFLLCHLVSDLNLVNGFLLLFVMLWIPFGLGYMLMQNLLIGIKEIRIFNIIELIGKSIVIALIGIIILFDFVTVESVFAAGMLGVVFSFIWALKKNLLSTDRMPKLSWGLLAQNVNYGIKAYLAALFSFLVLRADLLIVQTILGKEQAGYYSITATMGDFLFMLPVTAGSMLFPRLASMVDMCDKYKLTHKITIGIIPVMIMLGFCFGLLADPLIRTLFGVEFLPAAQAFKWLIPGIVMLSVNVMYMNYFASIGMPPITVYSPLVACVINMIGNYKLIPIYGIVGASISSTLAYGIMLLLSICVFYSKGGDNLNVHEL